MQTDSQKQIHIKLIPTKYPHVFTVELHLPFKTVYTGKLELIGEGCFRCKRKTEHIHKKLQAWGVNAEVLEKYSFKWVTILCDGKEYVTSREFLLAFGKRLTFKNYETQYFLPIYLWGIDMVKEFERKETMKPKQLYLFSEIATTELI